MYHIVFRVAKDQYLATSINITADSEILALIEWRIEYPTAEFLYAKIVN